MVDKVESTVESLEKSVEERVYRASTLGVDQIAQKAKTSVAQSNAVVTQANHLHDDAKRLLASIGSDLTHIVIELKQLINKVDSDISSHETSIINGATDISKSVDKIIALVPDVVARAGSELRVTLESVMSDLRVAGDKLLDDMRRETGVDSLNQFVSEAIGEANTKTNAIIAQIDAKLSNLNSKVETYKTDVSTAATNAVTRVETGITSAELRVSKVIASTDSEVARITSGVNETLTSIDNTIGKLIILALVGLLALFLGRVLK